MELVKEVDHPNIVIHLDSYHMNIEEGSLSAAVETCGDLLGYVHVGESHRGYLGSGESHRVFCCVSCKVLLLYGWMEDYEPERFTCDTIFC